MMVPKGSERKAFRWRKVGRLAGRALALLALCVSFDTDPAFARFDPVPGSRYTSARAAALGDAFLPLADDAAAGLFYNPAALAKLRSAHAELTNFSFYGNSDYMSAFDLTNFFGATSLSSYASTLAKNPSLYPGMGAAFAPAFAYHGLAFGILAQGQFYGNSSNGVVSYRSNYQLVPTFGTGFKLASGVLRFGYSLQWVNQASGEVSIPSSSSVMGYNQLLKQGAALSHNVGFALTLPYAYLPALNIVARNVGNAKYQTGFAIPLSKNTSGAPDTELMSVDASFSMQLKTGKGGYLNYVAELRDATNSSKFSLMGRISLGLEYSFRDALFLRAGMGDGYPSAGIGFRQSKGELSLGWYGEEVGQSFHERKETKFLFQYQVRAF